MRYGYEDIVKTQCDCFVTSFLAMTKWDCFAALAMTKWDCFGAARLAITEC